MLPAALARRLRGELARMVAAAGDYEVAVRVCDDAAIHELNATWRGKDKPTDVLAFAQGPFRLRKSRGSSENRGTIIATADPRLLGDIVISLETARAQAKRGLHAELLHLASHGLCHLLGYDHRDDREERAMNTRAAALRRAATRAKSPSKPVRRKTRRTARGRAARA